MNELLKNIERIVRRDNTLIHALKIMDSTGFRSLLVIEDPDLFIGVLSIGDIQRAIIANKSLETALSLILRQNPRVANENTEIEKIKSEMLQFRMEFMPVIDSSGHIKKIFFWDELFLNQKFPPKKQFNLPVVIMAGGIGNRLRPLTSVLPKPLIPIGEKTIIEEIFERFGNHGCDEFLVSINYKAELIEFYLQNQSLPYKIEFFRELKPMGTAGSLSLIRDKINQTFFVSNCDILIDQDYSEILEYHRECRNMITIVSSLKHYPIPYGTVETGENGQLLELKEKPELTFKINCGMYVLEPQVLKDLKDNEKTDITQLIETIKNRNEKIGVFPISEKSWKDIGTIEEYTRVLQRYK